MTMVGLAIIELTNCVHRKRRNHNIGFALFLGLLEMWIAIALLVANIPGIAENDLIVLRVSLLSGYVLFASVVTIVMGFKGFDNMTDRFMWIVNGMLGCVLALVMFNGTSILTHLKLFGTYLMINGLTEVVCRIVFANVFTRIPVFGYWGIWMTTGLTWAVTAIVCVMRYRGGKWRYKALEH